MLNKLQLAGLPSEAILRDARPLLSSDVLEQPSRRGFRLEGEDNGQRRYSLGNAQLYRAGQRAVLDQNGSATLVTFAEEFLQIIEVDGDGRVLKNSIQRIPV